MDERQDPVDAFLIAATAPRDSGHASGTLDEAESILAARPEVARASVYTSAVLGDEAGVRRFLALDPANATATGGPHGWDALTYLAFSRYLRLEPGRGDGFVRAATALLDAGASALTGWFEPDHQPGPAFESVIYGAAGVARHEGLTRLLLARGADPNDDETPYHAPETDDNGALRALVESGSLTANSLATLLLRKADWHDTEGIRYLLEHGADPDRSGTWRFSPMYHAVRRDNALGNIALMLDHGGNPTLAMPADGTTVVSRAARRGRGDLLRLFRERGFSIELGGVERLIGACALGDADAVRAMAAAEPALVRELRAHGGTLLAEFAGTANDRGVALLLELGVPVDERYEGDGYFGIAPDSTALHVAAWKAWPDVVQLLIARGAAVDARDGGNRTPLALAVTACVDSYWTERRTPAPVAALLAAGASASEAPYPSGYAEVDLLLHSHGR